MGLAGFSLLFNEPPFADAKFAVPLADEDRIRQAKETMRTVIRNTDVIFVDAVYLLLGGTDHEFATGQKFYYDRAPPPAAVAPMTMQQLAFYVYTFLRGLILTRTNAKYIFIGVDNHVHVPVTKHREWGSRSYTAANDNARFHAGGLKSPFSRNEETLAFNIIDFATTHAGQKQGIRDAILGLTFTRAGPLMQALVQDRNTRPIFMSLLFQTVFGIILDDREMRPTLSGPTLEIVLLHPIFNFHCSTASTADDELLHPNHLVLTRRHDNDTGVTEYVSTGAFHIGEADIQYAGLLRLLDPSAQVEVLSDDTDLVIITLLAGDVIRPVLQWMGDQRVIDLAQLRRKAIPEFMKDKVLRDGDAPWAVRLFVLMCLVVFGNDFYDNPSNIGSTVANFIEAVSLLGKMGLTEDERRALGNNWMRSTGGSVTFDMSLMIRVTRAVYIHLLAMKKKDASTVRVAEIFRYKQIFADRGDRDLARAWTEYIDRPGKFGGYHPVSAIKVDLDGNTDHILKYDRIASEGLALKLFGDICTPQQMIAFTHNVVAMFDIDNPLYTEARKANDTIQIFETMPHSLEGFPLPVLAPQGFVMRRMTKEIGLELKNAKDAYQQLGADGSPSASQATAQVIFRDFDHSNAITSRVAFPGDLSLPSLFARVGMMQWLVCYWMFGFHPSASKQSTTKVPLDHIDIPPTDARRIELVFDMEQQTQMATLIILGGHRLHYETAEGGGFRLRHIVRTCNYQLIHALREAFAVNAGDADSLSVTMTAPGSVLDEARIRSDLYATLDATGLYIPLEDVVASGPYITSMDPELLHVRDCLVSLRVTRLDQMVTLSRLDPDWVKRFFQLMLAEARTTRPETAATPAEFLYPDAQLVFIYLYAKHFTDVTKLPLDSLTWSDDQQRVLWDSPASQAQPVQLIQSMPFAASVVTAEDGVRMLTMMQAATTRVTEVDSAVDVTVSSNALGEFSTGFADSEGDNVTGNMHAETMSYDEAEAKFNMRDWLHYKPPAEKEDVTVYSQNLAIQGAEAFISGVQLATPHLDEEIRLKLAALATAGLYFDKVAKRIVTHDAVTAREFITLAMPRSTPLAESLERAKHAAVLIEDGDLLVPCLSGSHDINAYALPLLRYMFAGKGVDTEAIWTRVLIPLLPLFGPYMAASFEFFMMWKMGQSVYLQYISEIDERDDEWVSGFHFVRQFLGLHLASIPPTWTERLPVEARTLDMVNFDEFRATWPTAMLLSEGIKLGELGDAQAQTATAHLLKDRARGNFWVLSTFFPSVVNFFVRAIKTDTSPASFSQDQTFSVDVTLLFVNWRPHILEHYLLVCLHRAYVSLKQLDGAIPADLSFTAFAMHPRFTLSAQEDEERVFTEFGITIATASV